MSASVDADRNSRTSTRTRTRTIAGTNTGSSRSRSTRTVAGTNADSRTRTRTRTSLMTADYVRLPEQKERCVVTGMSRSWVLERIRESQGGEYPIRSFHIRQPGAARGIVLIERASLVAHIESFGPPSWADSKTTDNRQQTDR